MSRNEFSKRQELSKRLVQDNVIQNVTMLVDKIAEAFPEDTDDLCSSSDYEAATQAFIEDCDDLDQLEEIADRVGFWDDYQKEIGFDPENPPKRPDTNYANNVCIDCHYELQGVGTDDMDEERTKEVQAAAAEFDGGEYLGEEYDDVFSKGMCACCGSRLAGARFAYQKPEDFDTIDFEAWLDEDVTRWNSLRSAISKDVSGDDLKFVCDEFEVDMSDFERDVYEYWLVSDWIAEKLEKKGEVIGDLYGLTIWGRCCTGQAIYLDQVWEEMALEFYADEWKEFLAAKEAE